MINRGAIYIYCKDDVTKIENYAEAVADKTATWHCHHRLELTLDGEHARTKQELIRMGMYYNRPHYELILLRPDVHSKIHHSEGTRSYRSDVARRAYRNRPDDSADNWEEFMKAEDAMFSELDRWVQEHIDELHPRELQPGEFQISVDDLM